MQNQNIFTTLVVLLAAFTLTACKPEYPKCKTDDHCRVESRPGDVCVNGTCQECIEDAQCEATKGLNYFCNGGRCDPKPEEVAQNCTETADCSEGFSCQESFCVEEVARAITCDTTDDCDTNADCIKGTCQARGETALSSSEFCQSISTTTQHESSDARYVRFEFNNHELSPESRSSLEDAAECMKLNPTLQVVLEGHCDERGTQEYNLALGEKRANTVKGYLRNLGVDSNRLVTRTLGENKPRCIKATEECHAVNRRVEFLQMLKN